MNHDITHCEGIDCAIRDDCFRYKAHLEVEIGDYKYPVAYFDDGCEDKVTNQQTNKYESKICNRTSR